MAALDFPLNPTTTSEVTTGDITWKWNGYAWYATTDGSQVIHVGATPPDPALEGQMWWADTDIDEGGGRLYIYTGDEWVDTSLPGGESGGGGDSGGGSGSGASAWGRVDADGNKLGSGVNFASASKTADPGVYQVTFTTPMPSTDYSVNATPLRDGATTNWCTAGNLTTTGFTVRCFRDNNLINAGFSFAVHATNALPPKGGTGADGWAVTATDASLLGSFNIESCTKPVNGQYDYVFTTPMPTADYAVMATSDNPNSGRYCTVRNKTTDGFSVYVWNSQDENVNGSNGQHSIVVHATNAQLPNTITEAELDAALNSPGVSAWGYTTVNGGFLNGLNIASMNNSATGVYEYTFTTPMPNAQYSIQATAFTGGDDVTANYTVLSTTGFTIEVRNGTGALAPSAHSFTIHATNAQPPKGGTGADAWARTGSTGDVLSTYNLTCVKAGAGVYNYTFNVAMPNANYAVVGNTSATARTIGISNNTTTGFTLTTSNQSGTASDSGHHIAVFATNATLPQPLNAGDLLFTDGRNPLTAGLQFPSTQVSSSDPNTLDDYEEGTFTPTLGGATAYTYQDGTYTKIGNRVWFNIRMQASAATGDGTNWFIGNLPFTSASGDIWGGACRSYGRNLDGQTFTDLGFHITRNSNGIFAYNKTGQIKQNTAGVILTEVIIIDGWYTTA